MKKKPIFIPLVISMGILIAIFVALQFYEGPRIRETRDVLIQSPVDVPEWIRLTGPQPGEILSFENAVYAEVSPFWPSTGTICAQLDKNILGFEPRDALEKIKLYLDGHRVYEITPGILLYGVVPKDGIFVAYSDRQEPSLLNYCLAIRLDPGPHLIELRVQELELNYLWAFRTN